MAILNSIRKQGIFLILIIALALFAFILSDVLTKGGSVKGQNNAMVVNGTDIPRVEFMQKVETMQRNMGQNGNTAQAINTIYEQEVRRVVLEEQYEKLGLTVEAAQISNGLRANLAGNQNFVNETGQFDDNKMQQYIANVKASNPVAYQQWLDFEKSTEQNVLQNTYFTLIRAGLGTTLAEGEQAYRFENDKVNLEYVQIPYTSIPDTEVEVSNDEIKNYVKDHPKDFEAKPQADIQYVLINEAASKSDIEQSRGDIEKLLNDTPEYNAVSKSNDTILGFRNTKNIETFVDANSDVAYNDVWLFKKDVPPAVADALFQMNKGEIYGPYELDNGYGLSKVLETRQMADTAMARHILIPFVGLKTASPDVTLSKEDAKKRADSIVSVIKKDNSKFEALAVEFSSDNGSKDKGGDLGAFPPGRMVPAFNDFIFDNPKGTIGVVETDFGYHVVSVDDLRNEQTAMKVATIIKAVEPSEATINEVFSKASKFEVAASKGDFNEVAKKQNLTANPVNKIGRLDSNIPGVGDNREIVNWAFNEDTNVGNVKRFTVPNGYVIAQLTRKSDSEVMDVTEASAVVTPILRNKKKAEKIKEKYAGKSMTEIASSINASVQNASAVTMVSPLLPGAGNEPKVVGKAFGKKVGETTDLIAGNKGVYIVKIISKEDAPKLANYATFSKQQTANNLGAANGQVFNALKEKAEIEDNRADLF